MKARLTFAVVLAAFFAATVCAQEPKPAPTSTSATTATPAPGRAKFNVVTFELPSWGNGAPGLLIELPEGFTIKLNNGTDFNLYSVVRPEGDHAGSIGIYVGYHPNTNWPATATKKSAVIDSVPVVWRSWRTMKGGESVHHSETIVDGLFPCQASSGKPIEQVRPETCGLKMHVFIEANQLEEVEKMVSWIGTLRKKI